MHKPAAPVLDSPGLQRFGFPELITVPNPAAGATYTYNVTGEYLVRLISIHVRLVTDANAANREVVLLYRNPEGLHFTKMGINAVVTANLTADYVFSAFQPEAVAAVDSTALIPLHPVLLMPTWSFRLNVVNIQATDQLSQIRIMLERFYSTAPPGRDGPHPGA